MNPYLFTPITGDLAMKGSYIVLSRRTGLILGNVWPSFDPYQSPVRGWCAHGRSGTIFRTRQLAAKALKP